MSEDSNQSIEYDFLDDWGIRESKVDAIFSISNFCVNALQRSIRVGIGFRELRNANREIDRVFLRADRGANQGQSIGRKKAPTQGGLPGPI